MRARRALGALLALPLALALAACGDRQLVLDVDLLSFIDPDSRSASFGTDIPAPATVQETVAVVDNQSVTLFQGLSDLTSDPQVTVDAQAVVDVQRDSVSAVLLVYVSEEGTDPRTTEPLMSQPVGVSVGQPDTVSLVLSNGTSANGDRIAELITHQSAQVAVDIEVTIPAGMRPVGSLTLTQLRATVVARRPSL